jgi:ABC-type transport system involved in multi-copper enzyme maturation permease subunit
MWKDFRNQSHFLLACVAFLIAPYVVTLVFVIANQLGPHAQKDWHKFFLGAAIADVAISMVLVAFFSGNIIAGERTDRSAEFVACLPVTRRDAIVSKALVALGLTVGMLTACVGFALWLASVGEYPRTPPGQEWAIFVGTCVATFGVAWLVSSFAHSGTYAAAAGIAVPLCYGATLGSLGELESLKSWDMSTVYFVSCLLIGVTAFVVGVVYYLRRVTP